MRMNTTPQTGTAIDWLKFTVNDSINAFGLTPAMIFKPANYFLNHIISTICIVSLGIGGGSLFFSTTKNTVLILLNFKSEYNLLTLFLISILLTLM